MKVVAVESRCGAVALGSNISVPASFVWRCLTGSTMAPFHIPLIEPDMQISRIRLSDNTSRLRPRHVVPKPAQAYEPKVPVKMREWIGPALASPGFVLDLQPPAQPHRCVAVKRPIRFADSAYLEVAPIRAACGSPCPPALWFL